ncbi:hypothetical protein BDV59DRAFT_199876 [Aspergillus ambiguus]|uniref:BRCT domain protein n=1 Tax=Aspergillus ambiguus TaxID=176160 RepID=UPI003CCD3EAC
MGKSFEKIHASSAGFVGGTGRKIVQWVRANGGKYSKDVDDKVTHLITTTKAFKENVGAVRAAKRLRTIKIVSYDWLEDSLLSRSRKPRREGPYLLDSILRAERKRVEKSEKSEKALKVQKQTPKNKKRTTATRRRASVPDPENSDSHVCSDETGTVYSATLTRQLPSKASREKYQVKVYRSNTEPHSYSAHWKYSRIGRVKSEMIAPFGSSLEVAISKFEQFFEAKTGKKWADRLDGIPPPKQDDSGAPLAFHEGWFHYDGERSLISNFLRQSANVAGEEQPRDGAKQETASGP